MSLLSTINVLTHSRPVNWVDLWSKILSLSLKMHSKSNFCGNYLEAQGTKEHFRTMPNASAHAAPLSVRGKEKACERQNKENL